MHLVCHLVPVPAPPMPWGAGFFLFIAWFSHAGKPGQGLQERDTRGKAKQVGPRQRWELDLSGLLNTSGDRRLGQSSHLWEAT